MGSIAMYQYESLEQRDSIRLLRLLPSNDIEADLHGEIVHTTISNEVMDTDLLNIYPSEAVERFWSEPYQPSDAYSFIGGYTALSYTWVDPEMSSTIYVDGKQLGITANLEQALRSLRLEVKTPRLWVDSICINQADAQERSQQVQQMCSIYKTAASTIIYLGPSTELSTSCFKSAANSPEEPREYLRELKLDKEVLKALKAGRDEILGRSWFTRAWTFQELVVSRRPWMCCGTQCLPWSRLCTYFLQKRRWNIDLGMDIFSRETMFSNAWERDPWGLDDAVDGRGLHDAVDGRYSIIREPETNCLRITPKGARIMDKVRQIYQAPASYVIEEDDKFSLFTLLEFRQGFATTDPRDAVFSLYGVLDNNDPAIMSTPVNYEKSTPEVYIDLSTALLSTDEKQGYAVFTHVENDRSIPGLPSWVPNFAAARKYDQAIRSHVIERRYCTFKQEQITDFKIYKNLNAIVCRGHHFLSKITKLSEALEDSKIRRIEARIFEQGDGRIIVDFSKEGNGGDGDIAVDNYKENGVGRLCYERPACLKGRRIATMDDGGIALVPEGAILGDMLCVLKGGSVPWIVREKNGDISEGLDEKMIADFHGRISGVRHCTLIGQCWKSGFQVLVEDIGCHDTGFMLW
ncbi:HET-domain-containing protein [Mollisia scopiformis]|uniref:HET-domain-containing protein n=1 Tax=Mollisia scopiformis TaxID=149040 RepID=A0A132B394_MOLSC|nr:HET-domain-containing protein [Mollisia scopiformis]KUJ06875.1 HET-domain-containing protein [Mollisia scopiformis]